MGVVSDNVALAKKGYEYLSVSAADRRPDHLTQLFDLMADDIVFKVTCPVNTPVYGGEFRGKEAVIGLWTQDLVDDGLSGEVLVDCDIERPPEYYGSGDRVIVLCAQRYTIRATGCIVRNKEFAAVLHFRDGLIDRIVSIEDCSELLDSFRAA